MNQTLKAGRQYYLDVVRVMAIFAVALNHGVKRSFVGELTQAETFVRGILWILGDLGVPLFLMITGILILNKPMETFDDVKRFYKKNLLPLLITTEIWLVLIYWYRILFDSNYPVLYTEGFLPAVWGMVKTMLFVDQVTFASMWYMPMILCLYTTLPLLAMVKDKRVLLLPVGLVFLYQMVLPAVNVVTYMGGHGTVSTVIREADLISYFYVYILAGYFVGKGCLSKLATGSVAVLGLITYVLSCTHQIYAYGQPLEYTVSYPYPLLPLCAMFLLELLRRCSCRKLEKPVTYVARITFAIYLMHMVVLTTMNARLSYTGWSPVLKTVFMVAVSVGISIAIIAPLSKIKLLKKYLFLIK